MSLKDEIALGVIEYYSQFPEFMRSDVLHTQEVVSYTRLIASGENLSERQVDLLEISAWLHDIGCPKSKCIYGNCLPKNQQCVGEEVAKEFLEPFDGLTQEEKDWLANVVATHHKLDFAKSLNFMPLYEGDLIANILSGYFPRDKVPALFKTFVHTKTGKALFKKIFKDLA
ncbi:MAG: HD domain-containing protein [Opitutales bacterium]